MPDRTLDVDVTVSGQRRRILTFKEKKNGDSFVFFAGPPFEEGHRILEHRYTIHPSPKDPTANLIKFTRKFRNGEKNNYLSTPVIKSRDGFTTILTHCCDDLQANVYNSRNRENSVHFTEYDSRRQTLVFSLLIGHADLVFDVDPIIATSNVFNGCRFVMLYKLMPVPSTTSSYTHNQVTFRAEDDARLPTGARRGMSPATCLEFFDALSDAVLIGRETYGTPYA